MKESQNENKYDISKSNFFANIEPENKKDSEDKRDSKEQISQSSGIINTPISNINNQNNFFPNQNKMPQYNF